MRTFLEFFFFFFLFSFFLFFFFFFLLFTFENDGNLFWVHQNGKFLPEKRISRREKKIRKNDFAPLEKYDCYAPVKHSSTNKSRLCGTIPFGDVKFSHTTIFNVMVSWYVYLNNQISWRLNKRSNYFLAFVVSRIC